MSIFSTLFKKAPAPDESGPLYAQVKDAIHEVQAYARSHGGSIDLLGVNEEGDVRIRLSGTCRGCPMSQITVKLGIEGRLKVLVPGVRKVIQTD